MRFLLLFTVLFYVPFTVNYLSAQVVTGPQNGTVLILKEIVFSPEKFPLEKKISAILQKYLYRETSGIYISSVSSKILSYYENNGYPYVRISIKKVDFIPPDGISINFRINPGKKVNIDSVYFNGSKNTAQKFLIRESGLKTGKTYNHSDVDRAVKRLSALPFVVVDNKTRIVTSDNGKSVVNFKIRTTPATNFSGIIGYIPSGKEKESGYLVGSFNVKSNNLFGTGRQINIFWNRKDRDSQEAAFSYREPWLLGLPVHAGFNIRQDARDSTFVKRNIGASIEVPFFISWNIKGAVYQERVTLDERSLHLPNMYASDALSGELEAGFDSRDNPVNPIRGILYSTTVRYSNRDMENLKITQRNFSMDFMGVLPFYKRNVLFARMYWSKVNSAGGPVAYSELYTLGGAADLRGYREKQFRGTETALSTIEYRYVFEKYSRLFLFYDHGFIKTEENRFINRPGFGCGLRISTRQGMWGIDFGWGRGDSFDEGKVHISLNSFF